VILDLGPGIRKKNLFPVYLTEDDVLNGLHPRRSLALWTFVYFVGVLSLEFATYFGSLLKLHFKFERRPEAAVIVPVT
jgi:hypothetical protein